MAENLVPHVADAVGGSQFELVLREAGLFDRGAEFQPPDHRRRIQRRDQNRHLKGFRRLQDQRIDRTAAGHDHQPQLAVHRVQMDFGAVADDHRQFAVVGGQVLLEAVQPHRRDVDLEILRGFRLKTGQVFALENLGDQLQRRVYAAAGQPPALVAAGAQQIRKQIQTGKHPQEFSVTADHRQPRQAGFAQPADRVEQRAAARNGRDLAHQVPHPRIHVVAALRRRQAETRKQVLRPIGEHPRAERGHLPFRLAAAQFRESDRRREAVDIRVAVAADQNHIIIFSLSPIHQNIPFPCEII